MRLSVVKAEDIIGDIASRLEPEVAAAFRQAVSELRQQLPTGFIRDLLEAGDYGQLRRVLAEIRWSIDSFPGLRQALRDTATQAAAQATIDLDIDFNLVNPYAVQWADQHAAELVTSVSDETRAALARITTRAQSEGLTVQAQTRLIESVVGLTEQHAVAVANHMQGLMDDGFSEREAIRMSQTMRDRLLRWRATNIARTETIKAANMGTQIGWQRAQAQGRLTTLAKVWIVSPDERLCPQCAVLEGNIVSVDSNFVATTEATGFNIDSQTGEDRISIAGERVLDEPFTDLTPPRHPQCRCTIGLTESEQTITAPPEPELPPQRIVAENITTVEDMQRWADDRGINLTITKPPSVETMQATAKAVDDMRDRFPHLSGTWGDSHPSMAGQARGLTDLDIGGVTNFGAGAQVQRGQRSTNGATSKMTVRSGLQDAEFARVAEMGKVAASDIYGGIIHEMGHVSHNAAGHFDNIPSRLRPPGNLTLAIKKARKQIWRDGRRVDSQGIIDDVSTYAVSGGDGEFFAEMFTARNDPAARAALTDAARTRVDAFADLVNQAARETYGIEHDVL